MKKFVYILVVSFLFIYACSTQKNTFINRNFHSTTAKYNVLYNGKIALEKGKQELADQYEDNYWETLPIEPLQLDIKEETIKIPRESEENGEATKTQFDIAEEKAVKSIQKHGMNIAGVEHNKQTDDAYLLLGKARYYSQRFVPALEAFDYLLKNFQTEDLGHELNIWKAKTQIRLQNEERAIKTLRNLLNYQEVSEETRENAHTALAMAYLKIDSTQLAIKQLTSAIETQHDTNQYTRNLIILGQLYRQEQEIDSSQNAFKKVLAFKKAPHKYKMHAYIEQAKNINDTIKFDALQLDFAKLIKTYENKAYLDELYYQTALMDFRDGNDSLALKNLSRSVHTPEAKNFQKGLSYEKAGDYYFDKADFINAGSFYDSVFTTVENANTKRIRKLIRKRKSLEEVIQYETTLKYNDSILNLVAMNETERRTYFENYVNKLKEVDKIAAIVKENQERAQNNTGTGINPIGPSGNEKGGKWYFYNTQAVGFGKQGFQRMWGNRELADNWRLSEKTGNSKEEIAVRKSTSDESSLGATNKYDVDHYLSLIPSDEEIIQKMRDENGNALYQLGLIYKEKFQEYNLATARLERFLSEEPKGKLILPAKYHLYRTYELTENSKLETIKQEILTEYPDSRFTQIIQNPEDAESAAAKKAPEVHYEKVYCDYEFERYASTLEQCEAAIKLYVDDPIQAKFDLLRSYAVYQLQGKEPFKTELEYVVVNYPKTEEGDHAQEVLDFLNGVVRPKEKEESRIMIPAVEKKKRKKAVERRSPSRSEGNRNNNEGRNPSGNKTNERGNNPHTRPASGSGTRPSGNNNNNNQNNQNSDSLGG